MIFRKSHIILIFQLFSIEILLMFLYLAVRIPKLLIISPYLDASQNNFLNFAGIIYFIFITLFELFMVLNVTLNWANEEYEIREGSIIHRKGIFKLREEIYTLRNLASSKISQDFFGKIFNYGTIALSSPIIKRDVFLTNVHDPRKIVVSFEDNLESNTTHTGTIIRNKN